MRGSGSRHGLATPSPGPPRLKKAPVRSTLSDFWGPMDPIGVQKSDSPKGERAGTRRRGAGGGPVHGADQD